MTEDLQNLFATAILVNQRIDERITFASVFAAFLIAEDPLSRRFQSYVDSSTLRRDEIYNLKKLNEQRIDQIRHDVKKEVTKSQELPKETASVRIIIEGAQKLLEKTCRNKSSENLDVRHIMASYIYTSHGNEYRLAIWNLNVEEWSHKFLQYIGENFPEEINSWREIHASTLGLDSLSPESIATKADDRKPGLEQFLKEELRI